MDPVDPNARWLLLIQAQDFVGEQSRNVRILLCGFFLLFFLLYYVGFWSSLLYSGLLRTILGSFPFS